MQLDGKKIDDKNQLSTTLAKKKVGDIITITLFRENQTQEVKAILESAPGQ